MYVIFDRFRSAFVVYRRLPSGAHVRADVQGVTQYPTLNAWRQLLHRRGVMLRRVGEMSWLLVNANA